MQHNRSKTELTRRDLVRGSGLALAQAVGITPAHVSMILNGKRTPSLPVAVKIAKHLGMTVDEFARRTGAAA